MNVVTLQTFSRSRNQVSRVVLGVTVAVISLACHDHDPALNDQGTIAFVNREDTVNHIFTMQTMADGTSYNSKRLTNDPEPENYPSWSPDGKKIAYQRDYNGAGIYIINADGSGQLRISPTPSYDINPSWSPDGLKIIYVRVFQPVIPGQIPETEIRIIGADGLHDKVILPKGLFQVEPRWSVKNQIVFNSLVNGLDNVFVMDTSGNNIRQLTSAGNNGDPTWSPDGTRIAFGSDRQGTGKLNIFSMNADGSDILQLTHLDVPYETGDTCWSGDGSKIVFEYDISGNKQSDPNAYAEVQIMNSDGTQRIRTGQACSGVGCAPRWCP